MFSFNLEKSRAKQSKIGNILEDGKKFTIQTRGNKMLFSFYENLFSKKNNEV